MQSNVSNDSFSMAFRFKSKIGCFVRKLCTFAHGQTFSQLTMTSDLLWKRRNFHISSIIFVISVKLWVYLTLHTFCQYCYSSSSIILFLCFKFYYAIVDIIVTFTYFSSVCIKPVKNVLTKTKKPTAISS